MLLGLLLGIDVVARVTNVSARTEHFLSLHFIFIKHGVTGSYATPRTVNSESPTMLATQISAKDADKMWADRASLFHISILLVFEGKLLNHGRYPIPVPSWMVIFSLYIFYVTWAILGHLHIQCGARTSVSHRVTGENICRVTARCGRKRCPNGNISSDTWHASMPQLWNCALSERAGGKVVMLESEKKGTKKVASLGTKITAYLMCQGFNEASQKKSFLWMLQGNCFRWPVAPVPIFKTNATSPTNSQTFQLFCCTLVHYEVLVYSQKLGLKSQDFWGDIALDLPKQQLQRPETCRWNREMPWNADGNSDQQGVRLELSSEVVNLGTLCKVGDRPSAMGNWVTVLWTCHWSCGKDVYY